MNKSYILISFLFLSTIFYAQELKYYGIIESGNLIIVQGSNIKWAWIDDTELKIDEQNLFSFGFDAKETGNKILKIKHDEGKVSLKKIQLPPRKYKTQKINNKKQQFSKTPDSVLVRIKRERNISKEARREIGKIDTAYYKVGFQRPIKGGVVTGVFGSQRILNGVAKNMHNGFDIAVPRGTPVYAMTDGIVRLTADNFYYSGNNILLDHGQGVNSFYLHLQEILVQEGDFVKKGKIIGRVGTTGRSTGPHLHWGVQWNSKRVDPVRLLNMKFN